MKKKEEEQQALFANIQMKCEYDCFEIVEATKYLEHMKRKGNITYENGISEVVSIERNENACRNSLAGLELQGNNRETT